MGNRILTSTAVSAEPVSHIEECGNSPSKMGTRLFCQAAHGMGRFGSSHSERCCSRKIDIGNSSFSSSQKRPTQNKGPATVGAEIFFRSRHSRAACTRRRCTCAGLPERFPM